MGYKYIMDSGSIGGPPAPLHPAGSRADWGGLHPGRRSPRGDGGEMGEENALSETIGVSSR